ncbi:YdaS family helix-turn-helix protein [Sphingomonas sp. PvP056]|jgi:DNA-binding transcriptional regulator YdaS (Cro superfamily)|uniref:transcriptional regulator n=1 Tax=Sphingomonas sp. PvP056 TaxID=3156392 RepID=UPI003395A3DD
MSHEALKRALSACGDNQSEFARRIGTSQQRVSYLMMRENPLPAELVLACERETGISRHDLRPDVYPAPAVPQQEAA